MATSWNQSKSWRSSVALDRRLPLRERELEVSRLAPKERRTSQKSAYVNRPALAEPRSSRLCSRRSRRRPFRGSADRGVRSSLVAARFEPARSLLPECILRRVHRDSSMRFTRALGSIGKCGSERISRARCVHPRRDGVARRVEPRSDVAVDGGAGARRLRRGPTSASSQIMNARTRSGR